VTAAQESAVRGTSLRSIFSRLASDYGMLAALVLLCLFFSLRTLDEQHPNGADGAEKLAAELTTGAEGKPLRVLIVSRSNEEDRQFAEALRSRLQSAGRFEVVGTVAGQPIDARQAMDRVVAGGGTLDLIACNHTTAAWPVFDKLGEKIPELRHARVVQPRSHRWPNFLKADNLRNVANQIVVIGILAIGMTLVIITGGIDLSVGSLIALSAVVTTLLIRNVAAGEQAGTIGMVLCSLAGMGVCGAMGLFSGAMVTFFAIPPFIVTLGIMLVASGVAYILAGGQSIYQVPASFIWLGRGTAFLGLPNAVVLMLALYAAAHLLMTRMALGRHLYAVGGNKEAARLSGVPVGRVLLFVYTACGALAGLGGVITASQLRSGSPTYGLMYELYVIAAVVVGGASLAGGEGKVLGTLIGAFIIAVIQNGMNLTGVESYTQKVVLGVVILGAVLLDMLKKQGRLALGRRSRRATPQPGHGPDWH
jgi:ribose transport system permease protein